MEDSYLLTTMKLFVIPNNLSRWISQSGNNSFNSFPLRSLNSSANRFRSILSPLRTHPRYEQNRISRLAIDHGKKWTKTVTK